MPQQLRILQCFECKIYQVDLVKKAKKWACKVCNAKQSVRCEHFRGSGAECRKRVQELNKQREQSDLLDSKLALEFAECFENEFEELNKQREQSDLLDSKLALEFAECFENEFEVDTTHLISPAKWSSYDEKNMKTAAPESNHNEKDAPNIDEWSCNVKQSVRCEHFLGSGPECLKPAQALNKEREKSDLIDSKLALEFAESFENEFEVDTTHLISPAKWPSNVDEQNMKTAAPESNHNEIDALNIGDPFCFQNTSKWEKENSNQLSSSKKRTFGEYDTGSRVNKKPSKWDAYL